MCLTKYKNCSDHNLAHVLRGILVILKSSKIFTFNSINVLISGIDLC